MIPCPFCGRPMYDHQDLAKHLVTDHLDMGLRLLKGSAGAVKCWCGEWFDWQPDRETGGLFTLEFIGPWGQHLQKVDATGGVLGHALLHTLQPKENQ